MKGKRQRVVASFLKTGTRGDAPGSFGSAFYRCLPIAKVAPAITPGRSRGCPPGDRRLSGQGCGQGSDPGRARWAGRRSPAPAAPMSHRGRAAMLGPALPCLAPEGVRSPGRDITEPIKHNREFTFGPLVYLSLFPLKCYCLIRDGE